MYKWGYVVGICGEGGDMEVKAAVEVYMRQRLGENVFVCLGEEKILLSNVRMYAYTHAYVYTYTFYVSLHVYAFRE